MEPAYGNPAFENTEEILENQEVPTAIVPYIRHVNQNFDPFDSISMFSQTTVPSEFAEIEIEAYELHKRQKLAEAENLENESKQKSNNIQYNLRFDKVVIVGGNESKEVNVEGQVTEAVNEITQNVNFSEIPLKYMAIDENVFINLIQKKKVFIPIICLILILIGVLSYFVYDSLTHEMYYQVSPKSTTAGSTFTSSTSNSPITILPTLAPIQNLKIVKRNDWTANESIFMTGKYKLMVPVNKIIILNAITSQCDTEETCMEYMYDQQQNAYPDYDDIRENFIIALDGTIFEVRGFEREGETTCESDRITCYNNRAISISFIQTSDEVNTKQHRAFCQFIKENQETGNIDVYFNVFNHNNLISSTVDLHGYESLKECGHFHNSIPQIVRRNKTLDVDDDYDLQRLFSTKVVITTTGGETCDTMETCNELVQNFHNANIHNSNFFFGGNGFIFEDRNFDLAVNESLYDVLLISFIGNYSTSLPSQPLITRLNNEFLDFAIVLGKLPRNHKICVTNETQTLINAMRNQHPSKYDNFCNEQI